MLLGIISVLTWLRRAVPCFSRLARVRYERVSYRVTASSLRSAPLSCAMSLASSTALYVTRCLALRFTRYLSTLFTYLLHFPRV